MSPVDAVATDRVKPLRRGGVVVRWLLAVVIGMVGTGPVLAASNEAARPAYATLIVTFLFVMGVSQIGVAFSAVTRLAGGDWARPYYRFAELSTMAFAPFAIVGFLLIYAFAGNELFYWLSPDPEEQLSPWLNSGFLLFRNLAGLVLFYGLSAVYVWKSLKPDLAGKEHASNDHLRAVQKQLTLLAPFVLIAFVVSNSFIAWDFAMMLVPHWHSTVFPIYYRFGGVYAGTAALFVFPAVINRFSTTGTYFEPKHIRYLSMMLSGFMLMWLYFWWAQFFVIWFGNLPRETDALFRQMYGHYAPLYWTMMAGCGFIPFAALIFSMINRSLVAMCALALGINVGIWISKYLMVIPVFSPDDRLLSHGLDLGYSILLLAGFIAVVTWVVRQFPLFCEWEIKLLAESSDADLDQAGNVDIKR